MGKVRRYQGADQANRWRKRAGRRMPSRRLPRPVLGLIFLGVGALAAAVTQFATQSTAGLQSTITNWTEPLPGPMQGRASVIDGDTIEIHGQRVRFNGVDAPESSQQCDDAKGFRYQCGTKAAAALDRFLAASRPVLCEFVTWDSYGRYVASCARADGSDVAGWLVENGYALDWPKYSNGAYAARQATAEAAKRGIWSGSFEKPWDWRAEHRDDGQTTAAPLFTLGNSGCNIKGNISADGERIYHVPGQKFYSVTRITEAKGERWFCSVAEARAAGWRRSKR